MKYTYKADLSPINLLNSIIKNNENQLLNISRNENPNSYFQKRHELKALIKNINSQIDNNSSTYFLSLYYMDLIFIDESLEKNFYSYFSQNDYNFGYNNKNEMSKKSFVLLSLACLITASKFNENDPHVPSLSNFISFCAQQTKGNFIFDLNSLDAAEVIVLKTLKYKMQYNSLYHFNLFFFVHGLLFKSTIERSKKNEKYPEKKILEKIYIISREIIDLIIERTEFYDLYVGKENYITSVIILLWSIELILDIKLNNETENIFKLVYNIDINKEKKEKIYGIINTIYHNKHNNKNNNFKFSSFISNNNGINNKINTNQHDYYFNSDIKNPKQKSNNTNNNKLNNKIQRSISSQHSNTNAIYDNVIKENNNHNNIKYHYSNNNINMYNMYNNLQYKNDFSKTPYNQNQFSQLQQYSNNTISNHQRSNQYIFHNSLGVSNYNKEQDNHISYGPNNRVYLNSQAEKIPNKDNVKTFYLYNDSNDLNINVKNNNEDYNCCSYHSSLKSKEKISNDAYIYSNKNEFDLNIKNNIENNDRKYYSGKMKRRPNSSHRFPQDKVYLLSNNYLKQPSTEIVNKKNNFEKEKNNKKYFYSSNLATGSNNQNINNYLMHFSPNNKNKKNFSGKEGSIYKAFINNENNNFKNIYKNSNLTGFYKNLPNDNKKELNTKILNFEGLNDKLKNNEEKEKNNGTIIINNNIHINTFYDKMKLNSDNNIQPFFGYERETNEIKNDYKNLNSKDFERKDINAK